MASTLPRVARLEPRVVDLTAFLNDPVNSVARERPFYNRLQVSAWPRTAWRDEMHLRAAGAVQKRARDRSVVIYETCGAPGARPSRRQTRCDACRAADEAVRSAVASAQLAGGEITPATRAILAAFVMGEIDVDEMGRRVGARYGVGEG